ncbi:MAG TPA: hypothetical protein VFY73_07435 [Ideonella sp.]|uniref:hypothetical protein n=1 Tax=Ideonella sp. TaxID=1929293 RepID=UPI002E33E7AE|nr:hypothetical protein [Ideonella sp.]HEX5683853.1 hypothetical protein [Ideonella sp.]
MIGRPTLIQRKEKTVTVLRMISHAMLSSALLMAGSAWAASPQKSMIPGFLDPKTGAFTTQVPPLQQGIAPQAATYNGTLILKVNITLKSGFPADSEILCTQNATVSDVAGSYHANKTVRATRSGSTATCTVSLYYSWVLSSGDQTITQTYFVQIINAGSGSLVQAEAAALSGFVDMPVNNGSVTKTVNVTL